MIRLGLRLDMERYDHGILASCISVRRCRGMVVCRMWNVSSLSINHAPLTNMRRVQIILFSVIACKVKENANGARTFLEIVRARFGAAAHIMFLVSFLLDLRTLLV